MVPALPPTGPILEGIAAEYAGSIKVVKVNVGEHKATARAYGVTAIPALWLFVDGRAVEQLAGFHTREQVLAMLDIHLTRQGQVDNLPRRRAHLLRRLFRSSAPAA